MSYLGTDAGSIAGGIADAIGGAVSSIAGGILDYRAIGQQQQTAGTARQIGMETLVEQEEYRRLQAQRDSEEAKARANAYSEAERALKEQEEDVQREILSVHSGQLRARSGATHSRGRTSSPVLWWVLAIGGVGFTVGAAFLLSKAGD